MDKIQLFNLFPVLKQDINDVCQYVINQVKDGEINALDFAVKLKAVEVLIETLCKSEITDIATEEAIKYGKEFNYKNAKIEVADVGVSYDYSCCDDEVLEERLRELKKIKADIDSRKLFLKSLKEPYASERTEGVFINPPIRKGKQSIKITLK